MKKITALLIVAATLFASLPAAYAETADLSIYEMSATASESEPGNVPINVLDGSTGTKWAAQGPGQWLQFRLEAPTEVSQIGLAFTSGDQRVYSFEIQTSSDEENWTKVFEGKSSGQTTGIEMFALEPTVCEFVRFVGYGSNTNAWNNISEMVGLSVKKIYTKLLIDNSLQSYYELPIEENGDMLLPVLNVLDSIRSEYSWDEENKLITASYEGQQFGVNFNTDTATVDGTALSDCRMLVKDNGVPMVSYKLFGALNAIKTSYDAAKHTVSFTTDNYERIMAAYRKIDEEFLGVMDWLVEVYDPESGGFYNTVSGARYEGYYPSLEATGFFVAMMDDSELGALDSMPDEFRQKLVKFFQDAQDPETGFFAEECEKPLGYTSREQMRVLDQATSKLKMLGAAPLYPTPEERISAQSANTQKDKAKIITRDMQLAEAQKEPEVFVNTQTEDTGAKINELPAGFPDYCRSVDTFMATIAGRGWDGDSWGAGDKAATDYEYIAMLDKETRKPYEEALLKWLAERQDPITGYWGASGDYGFNAVSGAFKVLRIYEMMGVCPPNAEKIIESVFTTLRSGYVANQACYVRNPLNALKIVSGFKPELKSMIVGNELELVELYSKYIHDMFAPDGGAGTSIYRSTSIFGGLTAGNQLWEGDMDGTQQMWLARSYLYQLFGREMSNAVFEEHYDEFWSKLMTKEKVVKEPYTAPKGVVVEEDFENVSDAMQLLQGNWGYRGINNILEVDKDNHYLTFNDKVQSDTESQDLSFPRVYGECEIECDLKFDREAYSKNNWDCSYSFLRIRSGESSLAELHAVDNGSDMLTLSAAKKVNGSNTYFKCANVRLGEWFRVKIVLNYNSEGKLQTKYYINGKYLPGVSNICATEGNGYVDGLVTFSSGMRCARVSIDNIKVTAK